jgi:hypothetical protein
MKLHETRASDLLASIRTELLTEDKTHRFYALQWLWDYVTVYSKDNLINLTANQLKILNK